jgi:hypothetical protein
VRVARAELRLTLPGRRIRVGVGVVMPLGWSCRVLNAVEKFVSVLCVERALGELVGLPEAVPSLCVGQPRTKRPNGSRHLISVPIRTRGARLLQRVPGVLRLVREWVCRPFQRNLLLRHHSRQPLVFRLPFCSLLFHLPFLLSTHFLIHRL